MNSFLPVGDPRDESPTTRVRPLRSRPLRVLIVERKRLAAEALMFTLDSDPNLEAIGYSLDGWEAVELIASYDPDTIVVGPDVVGLDQLEFCQPVHELFPHVRLITLREQLVPHEVEAAYAAGSADCLATSCSSDELLYAIAAARTRQVAFERAQRRNAARRAPRHTQVGAASA
jgi:DNA-binding NarL/FixJ family response regulator